jgi:hypothetical protein
LFLLTLKVEIPGGLPKRDYAEFRFNRQFAGLSPHGIPLSVKDTTGPAAIGAIPLLPEKPMGWHELPIFATAGLPVLNPNPRLAFSGIQSAELKLCVHADDLAAIVETFSDELNPQPATDVVIHKLTPVLLNMLVRHAQHLKLVLIGGSTYVRIPTSPPFRGMRLVRLSRADWAVLNRHVFSGNNSATLSQTTSILSSNGPGSRLPGGAEMCFKLPGDTLQEVRARWGVGNTMPCGFDGANLYFTILHVLQGANLGRLYPNAKRLEGCRIQVPTRDRLHSTYYSSNYSNYMFPLSEALDAGLVPANSILEVDASISTIWIPSDRLQVGQLRRPIAFQRRPWEESTLLCPQPLMPTFLLPAGQAVRKYAIPGNITPFNVVGSPGKYYLLADLQNLAPRNYKREREERVARQRRLVDRYGAALPQGYERLTDDEIALYFDIQDLQKQGEVISVGNHPLMPGGHFNPPIIDWLRKEAPHLIKTCPVSKQSYVYRLDSFEALSDMPGFWEAVESAFKSIGGKKEWLRKLVTCPKVQAAALISAL